MQAPINIDKNLGETDPSNTSKYLITQCAIMKQDSNSYTSAILCIIGILFIL